MSAVQHRQNLQRKTDRGVVESVRLLSDRQRSLDQWLGVDIAALSAIQLRQIVERRRNIGVVEPVRLLSDLQRSLDQWLGIGMAAFSLAAAHAVERKSFGKAIIDHQGIGFPLADVATELSAARMLVYEAARQYDRGGDASVIGPMAKLYASEAAHRAVDMAVQTLGGYGYVKPSPAERLYRDQRATEIYEGTSEIQRLVLARAIKAAALARARVDAAN